jgi:four helix bundle protein
MPNNRYSQLRVWQDSMQLAAEIYRTTADFPRAEQYGLVAQMRRAATSIPSNIAEGYGRSTRGEYLNHLSMAFGSLNELDTLCQLCGRLGIANEVRLAESLTLISRLQPMLMQLRVRLRPKG